MTRLVTIGLEAGSIDVFTYNTGCSISAVQKRTGAYSVLLPLPGTTWYVLTSLLADKVTLYIRFGFWGNGGGGTLGDLPLLALLDNTGTFQVALYYHRVTGLIKVYNGSVFLGTSINAFAQGAWHCVEWYVKINNAVGETTVKVNGITEIGPLLNQDTQGSGIASARSLRFGTTSTLQANSFYIDDIAVNDDAGAVNNSWIGRGGIYAVVPEGVGTYTDLHAQGHANPWDCISEVPPDDADYVYDDTVNQKSTYALTALVPTTGTIACINVIMRAKLDAAGTGNIARLIRSNATDSQGSDVGLDTSVKTIQENIETDPSGGGAWTIARVNALEAGAVVR